MRGLIDPSLVTLVLRPSLVGRGGERGGRSAGCERHKRALWLRASFGLARSARVRQTWAMAMTDDNVESAVRVELKGAGVTAVDLKSRDPNDHVAVGVKDYELPDVSSRSGLGTSWGIAVGT